MPEAGRRQAARFREARLADLPRLQAIRVSVTENVLSRPLPEKAYVDALTSGGRGWVAEIDGRVVGFSVALTDASVWALFVLPAFEGRGLGRALLALATDWLRPRGAREIRLATEPGTRAERLYRAQGWVARGRQANGDLRYTLALPSDPEPPGEHDGQSTGTPHPRPHGAGLSGPEEPDRGR